MIMIMTTIKIKMIIMIMTIAVLLVREAVGVKCGIILKKLSGKRDEKLLNVQYKIATIKSFRVGAEVLPGLYGGT
jgi:hypothetical protein